MLLGRSDELEAIRGYIAARQAVVLVGPAGIGKTTLARESLGPPEQFREGGALSTLAWSPLLVFRRLLRADPPERAEEVAGAVLQQGSSPVLLDDLQWSDDASLDAVAGLVSRVPVVATVRSGEERSEHVIDALTLVGAVRVDLGGLDEVSAAALADRLHPDLGERERAKLLTAADGNPLLLGELLKGPTAAPSLVSALVGRIASLPPDAQAAMHRIAVLGRPTEAELLGPGAAELVDAGLVAQLDDLYVVSHSLLAEVIVDGLGERADDVRRGLVAHVGPGEGAHLMAAVGDRPAARALALEAAHTGDRRRRATMLALAVECADDADAPNRVRAARMFTSVSETARARELCTVADLDRLSPVDRGSLLAATAEAAWLEGCQAEAMELTSRALVDLRGTRTSFEVAVLAGSTVAQTFVDLDGRPALERAREAVRLADEIGAEQGYARSRLASVLMTAGEPGWAELYREVIELAAAKDDDDLRRTAVVSVVLGNWANGDPVEAERVARVEVDRGPRQDFDATWLSISAYAAVLGLLIGRPRAQLVDEFLPLLQKWPAFRSRAFLDAAVILALADAGQHPAAADLAATSLEEAGSELQARSLARWAQGESAWLAGRLEASIEAAAATLALGVGDYPSAVQARLVAGHAARELGRPLEGQAPASLLPAWAAAPVEWRAISDAIDGEADAAVDGFLSAADGWAGNDVRSEVRCRWAAGDVAAGAGRSDAIALLEAAEARAYEVGLSTMVERIRRSLRSLGVSRRASKEASVGGLTGREARVLDLIGSGMRSAEVAAALGIGVSTVESFVRSAMQKLGTRTRAAAAARLAQIRAADVTADPLSGPAADPAPPSTD